MSKTRTKKPWYDSGDRDKDNRNFLHLAREPKLHVLNKPPSTAGGAIQLVLKPTSSGVLRTDLSASADSDSEPAHEAQNAFRVSAAEGALHRVHHLFLGSHQGKIQDWTYCWPT